MKNVYYKDGIFTNITQGGTPEVCELITKPLNLNAGNGQTVVAAVTGKVIRVMGYTAQGDNATAGNFKFLSNTNIIWITTYYPANTSNPISLRPDEVGLCETATGQDLKIDVVGSGTSLNMNLFYIVYTP